MTIPGSANPLLMRSAAPTAYQVSRSLRFNSSDSAYLSRVPSTAGNRKTWTWAGWVKRSGLGSFQMIFGGGTTSNDTDQFVVYFTTGDTLRITSGATIFRETTQVFRDPSSWYHFVIAVDTTQSTANDRIKFYVNGTQVTTFSTTNNPTQNADTGINTATFHAIGRNSLTPEYYFSGYLADIYFVDGQQLTPSSLVEVSATTGQLIPKAYTGTYGTNGFRLPFSDNSGTTATTLGKDAAGSNNWTPNNFSVTAGAGNDSLVDSPTSYGTDTGAGGEVRGNYATLNPLANSGLTISNGNLDFTSDSGNTDTCISTFAVSSGKWYWELNVTDFRIAIGIEPQRYYPAAGARTGFDSTGYAWWIDRQEKYHNGSSAAYGASTTTGDIIGVALDLDAGTLVFYKNNASQGTAYSGITGTYLPAICDCSSAGAATGSLNFGQRPFAYTAPSGFKALCTANLPTPTIANGATAMDVVTYTGTGATLTATSSLLFSPDLVWIKQRNAAASHALYDVVRGAQARLEANTTAAESLTDGGVTAFNNNGFTLGTLAQVNTNSNTYTAWCWGGGTSTVTNNSGSISSQVRASTSSGFSVVTYTGNGVNGATVGHGLGNTPSLILYKNRNAINPWVVYHSSLLLSENLILNSSSSPDVLGSVYWNTTAPTSSVFSLGTDADVNTNTSTYVAYCFTPIQQFSSIGIYSANGSTEGPFVFCGFRPRWLLIKAIGGVGNWLIFDSVRDPFNVTRYSLLTNSGAGETDQTAAIDFLSNGFKLRSSGTDLNSTLRGPYAYVAFAESPFTNARAR